MQPPPPPKGQSETKFFLFLGPPPIAKVDAIKKKLGWTTCFGLFSKWPPSKSGNHILCHNLSAKAVRVTKLVFIYMFLGARNSIMPIKKVSVWKKIYKQLCKRIFRAFSVIFCVSPWATDDYCAPYTHESLRLSFCCSLDLHQYQKSMPSNKSRMDYLFWAILKWPPLKFENITFCAITWVLR